MVAPPSLKVTVPLGVPAPGVTAWTKAVKVTAWPKMDDSAGVGAGCKATVVPALFTVCGSAVSLPVVARKLVSPL